MNLDRARAVADAVLFEGYALYPYRPTSTKNQLRWQFGVLAPRVVSEATRADPWWMETQCLYATTARHDRAGADGGVRIAGRLRFLRVRRRRVESPAGGPLAQLDVDGKLLVPWDEGDVCEVDFADGERVITLDGDETVEPVRDARGVEVARVRRTRATVSLRIVATRAPSDSDGFGKLTVRVENGSDSATPAARRDDTLIAATIGTHVLLGIEGGEFLSLIDPPAEAARAAAACKNVGVYPVLAGEPGRRDLVLASPIILYDHPAVAPESPGDLYDACEIDEILSLRTLLLTDEEKRMARATDPRVAALLDRVDDLRPEAWAKLHGVFRAPALGRGSRVRLKPGPRRTDAQDMFLDGRTATIRAVEHDVDGRTFFAVTVDDDPATALHLAHGRYHYFYEDEVELVG